MLRHVFVDVFKDAGRAGDVAVHQGAVAFRFLLGRDDLGVQFGAHGIVLGVGPDA
ncbi:hypothetical protein D3C71_2127480 [compost metagenome]